MEEIGAIGFILLLLTSLASYKGFRDQSFFDQYAFHVDPILRDKDYTRMISSGFLHGSWMHLIFNMIALTSFSYEIEQQFGVLTFAVLYFVALLGGNFLALYIHRNHGDYRAIGASGAISGVVFSFAILHPYSQISFILIPIHFTTWIFALLYIIISIFGIKTQKGNIGHEAHLGGAIAGMLITIALRPSVVSAHPWIIAVLLGPCLLFLYLIFKNPNFMLLENYWGEGFESIKSRVKTMNTPKQINPEDELDYLLDKIKRKGINSLSAKERSRLKELSDLK